MDVGSIDLKKLLCVSSNPDHDSTKDKSDRVTYTKDTLIILSKNAPCRIRPDCLLKRYVGENGLWDPEKWHRCLALSSTSLLQEDSKSSDNYEEADSNVILGPQRRSFQGGCHVASKEKPSLTYARSGLHSVSKLTERPGKPIRQLSSQDSESHPTHLKRFHSVQNDSSDWSKKDFTSKRIFEKSDHSLGRRPRPEFRKYTPPGSSNRRYDEDRDYRGNYSQQRYDEAEPEWISYGPKSQFDTIELSGFDGADDFGWMSKEIPMDDVPERKKKGRIPKDVKKSEVPSSKNEFVEPKTDRKYEENETKSTVEIEVKPLKETAIAGEGDSKVCETEALKEAKETGEAVQEPLEPVEKITSNGDVSKTSRFSRFFSNEFSSDNDESVPLPEKLALDLTKEESPDEKGEPLTQVASKQEGSPRVKTEIEAKSKPSSTGNVLHDTAAFNRLIASIKASDKVKEQIEQRNRKMQALQSMMKASQSGNTNCFDLSSVENTGDPVLRNSFHTIMLKQQLEKQKDAYQQKMRQIEQQSHKSSSPVFPNQDTNLLEIMLPGFSGQKSKSQFSDAEDERAAATASFAAKLAGKSKKEEPPSFPGNQNIIDRMFGSGVRHRADVSSPNSFHEQSNVNIQNETWLKLKRMQSAPNETTAANKNVLTPNVGLNNHLMNSSLAIAQMLAKAGVTEDQLKQLTINQQEMIISMVQNQYNRSEIGKFMNLEGSSDAKAGENGLNAAKANLSISNALLGGNTRGAVNNATDPYLNGLLSSPRDLLQANTPNSHVMKTLSLLAEKGVAPAAGYSEGNVHPSVASPMYAQSPGLMQSAAAIPHRPSQVMPLHPTIVSPVVPIMSPNVPPHVLTQAMAPPHLAHLVQPPGSIPPHPAVLLQMRNQVYASQVAAAQQQQAFLAALHKQQQMAVAQAQSNDLAKMQQNIQNMRLAPSRTASSPADSAQQDRAQFTNPLSQWFSRDMLRQSQFPPVPQMSGQASLKPYGADATKQ